LQRPPLLFLMVSTFFFSESSNFPFFFYGVFPCPAVRSFPQRNGPASNAVAAFASPLLNVPSRCVFWVEKVFSGSSTEGFSPRQIPPLGIGGTRFFSSFFGQRNSQSSTPLFFFLSTSVVNHTHPFFFRPELMPVAVTDYFSLIAFRKCLSLFSADPPPLFRVVLLAP